jgi:hypothetical protein
MKKILLSAVIAATTSIGISQTVIYSEDFESGTMPTNFILHNVDGLTPAASLSNYTDAWIVRDDLSGSNYAASSASWYTPAGQADDWMVIPGISIANSGTVLKWRSRSQDASFPDGYLVYVSTTGTDPSDFGTAAFSVGADVTVWGNHSIDLSAYAGQTVNIAFRNNSNDMFFLLVDDIEVVELASNDAAIASLDIEKYVTVGTNVSIQGTFVNEGANAITALDVKWSDGTNTYTTPITGLNLAYGASANFTAADQFNVAAVNETAITVWVELAGDANNANDEMATTIAGIAFMPTKAVVGEEGTGTWCQWCPRGAVFMDLMEETYGDSWIGVAVHNADPMTVTAYDSWMGGNISGYPSGLVGRDGDEYDPSQFQAPYLVQMTEFAHADIDVKATMDDNDLVTVNITANFALTSSLDYRLSAIVIENGVTGTTAQWNQSNAYSGGGNGAMGGYENLPNPVPAADMVYDHVGRALLGGINGDAGSVPASVTAGDSVTYTYTFTKDADWNISQLSVAALLLDNTTGKILNANEDHHIDYSYEVDGITYEVVDGDTFEYWDGELAPLGTTNQTIDAIRIFPNPASNYLNIAGVTGNSNITIYDIQGRIVLQNTVLNNTVDVSALTSGVYTVQIENNGSVAIEKLTVVK